MDRVGLIAAAFIDLFLLLDADGDIMDIIAHSSHVSVYAYEEPEKKWAKRNIEGIP